MKIIVAMLAILSCMLVDASAANYAGGDMGQLSSTKTAKVMEVRRVTVANSSNYSQGSASIIGGAVGAVAGQEIGGGRGSDLASLVLGIIGAGIGSSLDEQARTTYGYEIVLKQGKEVQVLTVLEENTPSRPYPGQDVRLVFTNRGVRLIPA